MNLWPVEQIFPHISADPDKKWGQKCSSDQWFIFEEMTSLKNTYFGVLKRFSSFYSYERIILNQDI